MGAAAAERCDDFGWHPRGRIDKTLVAETAQQSRFGLGHAWSRSAEYNLTTAPGRLYLVLTVEGGFEFTVDGTPVRTEPESLIVLDAEVPTTARTLTDTARYVWYLDPTFLRPGRSHFQVAEPINTRGAGAQALTAMTNALLGPQRPMRAGAQHHLALAFENLLAGVLEEVGLRQQAATGQHRDGLFMAAIASIETHFRDPAFTLARLARDLSVSVRTLHEAFRAMGSTPRREIERRRLVEVDRLTGSAPIAASEVAERAGFSSTRQLARAISRNH